MNRKLILPLALFSIILVSGCAGLPNLFGGDVVTVQTKVVENGQRDVIVVKDIQTIPTSPILPDQQILLSFIIENRDMLKDAVASVDLFNAPTMKSLSGTLCNLYSSSGSGECPAGESCVQNLADCGSGGSGLSCYSGFGMCCRIDNAPSQGSLLNNIRYCAPDQCGNEGCRIFPGEEKPISFAMRTPSESDIKSIKTDVKLNFRTQYNFDGSLNLIVPVVNGDEIVKRQRSGDKIDISLTKSHSSGPVQIDAQLIGASYILSNSGTSLTNPDSAISFSIRDRGTGDIVGSQINEGDMEILFPPEFCIANSQGACGGGTFLANNKKFICSETPVGTSCINRGETEGSGTIPLYLDETRSSLRFSVRMREPLAEPFRSFQITSTVRYAYEIRSSADVTINPFQNV